MSSEVDIDQEALAIALAVPLERALARICETEVARIKEELSVPVERDASGNVTVRSLPGESPRMDEGLLEEGVGYVIEFVGGLPEATIFASRPDEPGHQQNAAQVLEEGGDSFFGPIAPRPFMAPAAERITGYATEIVADELRDHE